MIGRLRDEIKDEFSGSHGFDHTERVYNLALHIAQSEKIDLEVLQAAALLHDISRKEEHEGKVECHADAGAEKAAKILAEIGFPSDKIPKVQYCIRVHRYSKGIMPETVEAKILQDADRLDALGAIGIARVFSRGGEKRIPLFAPDIKPNKEYAPDTKAASSINHFYEKLLNIKPESFHTHTGQIMAKERYEFLELFLNHFLREWECRI